MYCNGKNDKWVLQYKNPKNGIEGELMRKKLGFGDLPYLVVY